MNNYRPDIDGLRAFSIIAVVVYHAFPTLLPGGFVGRVFRHFRLPDYGNNSAGSGQGKVFDHRILSPSNPKNYSRFAVSPAVLSNRWLVGSASL